MHVLQMTCPKSIYFSHVHVVTTRQRCARGKCTAIVGNSRTDESCLRAEQTRFSYTSVTGHARELGTM